MAYTYFRLLNKVEDLERLMNDEVTDINEILNVINTIQVISNKTTGNFLCWIILGYHCRWTNRSQSLNTTRVTDSYNTKMKFP